MTVGERQSLRQRFAIYCANGNDNREPQITLTEAELLIWLAGRES